MRIHMLTLERVSLSFQSRLAVVALSGVLAAGLFGLSGCSSGSSVNNIQVGAITFASSTGTALKTQPSSLTAGQSAFVTVRLTNDPQLLGANWSVYCGSAPPPGTPLSSGETQDESCGTFTPVHTLSLPIPSYVTDGSEERIGYALCVVDGESHQGYEPDHRDRQPTHLDRICAIARDHSGCRDKHAVTRRGQQRCGQCRGQVERRLRVEQLRIVQFYANRERRRYDLYRPVGNANGQHGYGNRDFGHRFYQSCKRHHHDSVNNAVFSYSHSRPKENRCTQ
jgi:hypothetical protein